MVYYAVAKGRTIGVFTVWSDCKQSIDGFNGAIFKKFESKEDAENFVKTGFVSQKTNITKSTKKTSKYVDINFDSDSDSDDKPIKNNKELRIDLNVTKSKVPEKPVYKSNSNVRSKTEESKIIKELNFDSDSESDYDVKPKQEPIKTIKSKKPDKLDLLISAHNNSLKIQDIDDNDINPTDITEIFKSKVTNIKESIISLDDFVPDITVYTDGACINNGKPNAKASIGIYFGPDDPRNVSKKIEGKQSNNTAELGALIELYKILEPEITCGKKIAIYSDSVYAIRCVGAYGEKCKKNKWKKDDEFIPNKELVKEGYELFKGRNNIKMVHINSHTGLTDIHSLGNEEADRLANLALGIITSNKVFIKEKYSDKIYLEVPFSKKDQAKKIGCRWDADKKKWYINEENEEVFKHFKPLSNDI